MCTVGANRLHTSKTIQCGGSYIKLLTASEALSADGFTNDSPYTIMFGPCRLRKFRVMQRCQHACHSTGA